MSEQVSNVQVGRRGVFTKTVSETDVYLYSGITGDFSPNHVNEVYMSQGHYGRRIAHGTLLVGLMSAASAQVPLGRTVSLGYDRVRFVAPVFFGDTITTEYEISQVDTEKRRAYAEVRCVNQSGEVVAVATNVRAWVE